MSNTAFLNSEKRFYFESIFYWLVSTDSSVCLAVGVFQALLGHPEASPEHAGETTYLYLPGDAFGSPSRSCRVLLGWGMSAATVTWSQIRGNWKEGYRHVVKLSVYALCVSIWLHILIISTQLLCSITDEENEKLKFRHTKYVTSETSQSYVIIGHIIPKSSKAFICCSCSYQPPLFWFQSFQEMFELGCRDLSNTVRCLVIWSSSYLCSSPSEVLGVLRSKLCQVLLHHTEKITSI